MSEKIIFEPTPEQFGIFWKYLSRPEVTDVDYNGQKLWITDLKEGRYCANEEIPEYFISTFTHNISNCINKQFNNANKILEADTKELRISIIHESAAISGISICIRKSPCFVRNTLENLLDQKYCEKEVLHLLLNCVQAKMNLVFGGEPWAGKTECAKFFMQFIRKEERVITIEDSLEIHYANINPGADAVELRVGKVSLHSRHKTGHGIGNLRESRVTNTSVPPRGIHSCTLQQRISHHDFTLLYREDRLPGMGKIRLFLRTFLDFIHIHSPNRRNRSHEPGAVCYQIGRAHV